MRKIERSTSRGRTRTGTEGASSRRRTVEPRPPRPEPASLDQASLLHELRVSQAELARQGVELDALRTELAALRAKHVELHEHAPFAYVTLDAAGIIVDSNLAAARLLDMPRRFLLGKALTRFAPAATRDALADHLATAREGEGRSSFEVEMRRPDGVPLQIHLDSVPVGRDADRQVLVALVDTTERDRLEHQVRRLRNAELLGKMTGAVAHDFNNLLMGILGSADMALAELAPVGNARVMVEQIRAAVLRGSALTGKFLSLRNDNAPPAATDVEAVVRSSETILRGALGERIKLVVRAAGQGACVRVDPADIERILLNLVTNARRATAGRGRVVVEVMRLDLSPREARVHVCGTLTAGRYVVISVKDDGSGMDAATQAHIFEPFFSGRRDGRGTGLGLATVHQIVTDAGGHIQVQSRLGHGTTIRILLPCVTDPSPDEAPAPPPVAPAPPAPATSTAERTALVVDDDPGVRRALRHYLERDHFNVLEASSGEDALAAVASGFRLDLLLVDVELPALSGADVARELAATRPGLPVVFVSGRPPSELAAAGAIPPGAAVLHKPFDEQQLLVEIRRVCGAHRPPAQTGTLLLLEDNEMSRSALALFLTSRGYRVLVAASCADALRLAREHHGPIDVVLADLQLDDGAGEQIVLQLRPLHPRAAAVFMSGRDPHDPRVRRALAAVDAAFLRKPFELDHLADVLGALVARA